jgi:hypothetical protein
MNGILAHVEMAPNDFRRVDANRRYEAEARAVAKQAALADYITDDFEQRFEKHLCDAIERARPPEVSRLRADDFHVGSERHRHQRTARTNQARE